jgi:hypothetical protein
MRPQSRNASLRASNGDSRPSKPAPQKIEGIEDHFVRMFRAKLGLQHSEVGMAVRVDQMTSSSRVSPFT